MNVYHRCVSSTDTKMKKSSNSEVKRSIFFVENQLRTKGSIRDIGSIEDKGGIGDIRNMRNRHLSCHRAYQITYDLLLGINMCHTGIYVMEGIDLSTTPSFLR